MEPGARQELFRKRKTKGQMSCSVLAELAAMPGSCYSFNKTAMWGAGRSDRKNGSERSAS